MKVYVLNKEEKPLMPCKPVVARLLLKEGGRCIPPRGKPPWFPAPEFYG